MPKPNREFKVWIVLLGGSIETFGNSSEFQYPIFPNYEEAHQWAIRNLESVLIPEQEKPDYTIKEFKIKPIQCN